MKKNLFFVLLLLIIAACSKDDVVTPGQLKLDGVSGNELKLTGDEKADSTVTLDGITGEVSAEVDYGSKEWCSVEVIEKSQSKDKKNRLVINVKAYEGNEDRTAYVTISSGVDKVILSVIQSGRGEKVRMVVVSEGQFTKGTATLTSVTYNGTAVWDIFQDVNNKPLGDVAQSLTYLDGKYFVVLNNSKQIKVIEPQTFKLLGTVDYEQAASPRFMVPISSTEAIVSDLMSQLTRINYKTYQVVEHISLTGALATSMEKLVRVGNKVFGASSSKGVAVFDTDNITPGSIRLVSGFSGRIITTAKMIVDKNGKLWAFATSSGKSVLNCIDPATETVVKTIEIPYAVSGTDAYVEGAITGTSGYTRMDTDRSKGKLYFYMTMLVNPTRKTSIGAIFTLDVDKDAISTTPYRELPGLGMMYGMNISPDGDVFLCDCLDYTAQRGFLREYKADGSVISQRVGIYPRMVHFTEYDN
ncbi:MAG: BACON domain-containing carbohydrate-binding protein [Rikenellaceae bacterium]|nr:BACON domain-containing carbohydrate-binding protein [Rikenellaceae bacterium]